MPSARIAAACSAGWGRVDDGSAFGRAAAGAAPAASSATTEMVVSAERTGDAPCGGVTKTPPTIRRTGSRAARSGIRAVKALLADPELVQQGPELRVELRVAD